MRLSAIAASVAADAVAALLAGGYLRVYGDVAMVVECRFSEPAFTPAVDGVAIARPIASGYARGGMARTFRAVAPDGQSVVIEGTVGTDREADMVLTDTNIQPNAHFSIDSFTYTHHKETPK